MTVDESVNWRLTVVHNGVDEKEQRCSSQKGLAKWAWGQIEISYAIPSGKAGHDRS